MTHFIRLAFRSLLKTPGYTVVALFTLALGTGVNTAMFSLIDTLLFRPNPFPRPEQLVWVWGTDKQGWPSDLSDIEVREMRGGTRSFWALARRSQGSGPPGRAPEKHADVAGILCGLRHSADSRPSVHGGGIITGEKPSRVAHALLLAIAFQRRAHRARSPAARQRRACHHHRSHAAGIRQSPAVGRHGALAAGEPHAGAAAP